MKRIILALIASACMAATAGAQTVYSCDYKSDADLVVYKCSYKSDATGNNGLWYFVNYRSDAKKKIFFVNYKSDADLVIYFTSYKSEAGWRNKSKQHLMF